MNTQNMKLKIILLLNTLLLSISVFSQNVDPASVQVDQLSDQQIMRINQEIQARGLSMEQAINLAKARGASQTQIDQLLLRTQQLNSSQSQMVMPQIGTGLNGLSVPFFSDSIFFNQYSQKKVLEVSELNKRIFGHQLFNSENLSFEPSINIPIPKNYILGVGDQLQINIWGDSQKTYMLSIDTNGNVQVSGVGSISLAGKEFSEAQNIILKRLQAIYSDMGSDEPNTFADVSLSFIRAININVIGEVIAPGTYTIPATASAFNALYLSGGPNENGSFRKIKLIRSDETIAEIDVYDYLLNGKTGENILLRDQDILLIPTYEKRIELAGSFKRSGIFEVQQNEHLGELIKFAGGFAGGAYQKKVSVIRYSENEHQLLDIGNAEFDSFQLQDGDSIYAGEVTTRFQNRVSIEGAVMRPGDYSLSEGMTLSGLIRKAEGVREDHYSTRGLITRLDEQLFPSTIPFNVDEVLKGDVDFKLQREDQVLIRDIFSIGEKPKLKIFGEVMKSGEYDYTKNMTLRDLIFLAGGFTEAASQSHIEVARRNAPEEAASINDKMVSLFQFDIDRNLGIDPSGTSFILKPFDHIYVRKAPSYFKQETVSIKGEIKYPGQYSVSNKNERISDIIKRAGGLTPYANTKGARLDRETKPELAHNLKLIRTMQQEDSLTTHKEKLDISRLELNLAEILKNPGKSHDHILREGDEIYIPRHSDEIWVTGEVLNPIGQSFKDGKSLKYYINRSGGFSTNAKKGKVYIIYSDGTTKVTKSFLKRNYPQPMAGCQIVVPSKPPRTEKDTGTWVSIAGALSSLAIAAAALLK